MLSSLYQENLKIFNTLLGHIIMEKEKIKENLQSPNLWVRVGLMILFILLFGIIEFLIVAIAIVQTGFVLVTGAPNDPLKKLGRGFGKYACHIIQFLTFNTDNRPFPFTDWPSDHHSEI